MFNIAGYSGLIVRIFQIGPSSN